MKEEKKEKAEEKDAVKANNPFAITKETKSSSTVLLLPTVTEPFPMAYLKKVETAIVKRKDESEVKVINFIFEKNMDGVTKQHVHTEWPFEQDKTEEEFIDKLTNLQERVKHIYTAFAVYEKSTIGADVTGDTLEEKLSSFFDDVVLKFNTDGENNTPIYTGIPVWLKLIITIKYAKSGYQFPKYGLNFIERAKKGQTAPLGLLIDPKKESIDSKFIVADTNTGKPGAPGAASNAGSAFPDFPGDM